MSTSNPLSRGLPPPSWQDPSALGRAPAAAASGPGSSDWFGRSTASARVLSVQSTGLSSNDVDAWAQQLVNHLLAPADASTPG